MIEMCQERDFYPIFLFFFFFLLMPQRKIESELSEDEALRVRFAADTIPRETLLALLESLSSLIVTLPIILSV